MLRTVRQTIWWIQIILKVTWWLIRAPFTCAIWTYRTTGRLRGAYTLLTHDTLPCPGCAKPLSCVGRWQCSCGFVYDGHGFSPCPICGDVPPYLPCRCGVGVRNPTF